MTIKTVISETGDMIQATLKSVASFRDTPLMMETEEYVYELLILEATEELKEELIKAKKLLNGNSTT